MIIRVVCRIIGHKWVFVEGVSHGDDSLFECRRCGRYEWRGQLPETRQPTGSGAPQSIATVIDLNVRRQARKTDGAGQPSRPAPSASEMGGVSRR